MPVPVPVSSCVGWFIIYDWIFFISVLGGEGERKKVQLWSWGNWKCLRHCGRGRVCRRGESVLFDCGKLPMMYDVRWPAIQCSGSGMFILDPGSEFFPSRIPDPNFSIRIPDPYQNLSILTKKIVFFLNSQKYNPGCSSRIPDADHDFLPIPDPDPQHCYRSCTMTSLE